MNADGRRDLREARARYCYDDVARWPEASKTEAMRRVRGLSVEVRSLGLMVALGSLMSEDKAPADQLTRVLAQWLLKDAPHKVFGAAEPTAAILLAKCAGATRTEYAAAQREAILFYDQIKIYADALYGRAEASTGAAS
jgi:hypothetical protein